MGSAYSKKSLDNISVSEECFKLEKELNIAKRIFGVEHEKILSRVYVTHVALYKTPIEGIHRSSTAFVVLKTNFGLCLSLEKQQDGIYIGTTSSPQKLPVDLLVENSSSCPFSCLIDCLKDIMNTSSVTNYNDCQGFAKRIFNKICQEGYFKVTPQLNVARTVFGYDHESIVNTTTVTEVAVWKTPLNSTASIKEKIRRYWSSVDNHTFLVMKTNDGVCLSVEERHDGIYIGKSNMFDSVVNGMESYPQKRTVDLEIEDCSNYRFGHFIVFLKEIQKDCNDKCVTDKNYKDFSKRIFDKIAATKTWYYTIPQAPLYVSCFIVPFFLDMVHRLCEYMPMGTLLLCGGMFLFCLVDYIFAKFSKHNATN